MPRLDVPIRVQLGCADCYRFLLAERAKWDAERDRLAEKLRAYETRPLAEERDRYRAALEEIGRMDRSPVLSDEARKVLVHTAVPVAREALEGPTDA